MFRAPFWLAAGSLSLSLGCAHETPDVVFPQTASGWVVPANYAWPPLSSVTSPSSFAPARRPATSTRTTTSDAQGQREATSPRSEFARLGDAPRPRPRNDLRSVLPGSGACLAELSQRGVPFHSLDHELGVKTPIVVDGPITGVRYYTVTKGSLVADCRLVLALSLMGPALVRFGVSDVRFSGAYVYRLSNKHRVSLHAYGLAIDMHGFTRNGVHYEVEHDFKRRLGFQLDAETPTVNAIAVRFHNSGLFHEYLTPDDNADHHDHVHVGVSPLPDEVP